MPNKFRVKEGSHVHGGKVFSKGDIVVSDHDLVRLFPQKFENLGVATARVKEVDADADPEPDLDRTTTPASGGGRSSPAFHGKKSKKPVSSRFSDED